ncbi:MAG: cytochrome c5 family protein [Chlorobiaceae bacterium]|nr:cytochrome c5 family protein [Chlorobiaceae bacterium]
MKPGISLIMISGMFLLGACGSGQPQENIKLTDSRKMSPLDAKLLAGQKVYDANCSACHDGSVGGAPKPGDSRAWQSRIVSGKAVLLLHAVQGLEGEKGTMPPRGGNPSLSDDEITDAIAYMTSKSEEGLSDGNQDPREPFEKYQ